MTGFPNGIWKSAPVKQNELASKPRWLAVNRITAAARADFPVHFEGSVELYNGYLMGAEQNEPHEWSVIDAWDKLTFPSIRLRPVARFSFDLFILIFSASW